MPETDRFPKFLCARVLGGGVYVPMYPHFSKRDPHLYPHLPPDFGTLRRTFAHSSKPLPIGKKKKAGSSWKLPALSVVPGAGIEPARPAAGDFESPASTKFTTRAGNL